MVRVTEFEIVRDYVIRVTFDDQTEQTINFEPVLVPSALRTNEIAAIGG